MTNKKTRLKSNSTLQTFKSKDFYYINYQEYKRNNKKKEETIDEFKKKKLNRERKNKGLNRFI